MKKVVIDDYGGYEKLLFKSFRPLSHKKGEVLIEVKAIGVNFADIAVRLGIYESAKQFIGLPITPGFEVSGIVLKTDTNSLFNPGDKIIGLSFFGGYSTQISIPEHQVFRLPKDLSYEQGAAIPTIFLTAYYALCENFVWRPNQKILIHSAAGGVGSSLAQIAKLKGAQVIGIVGSSHKTDFAHRLNVDTVIDKSKENLWKRVEELAPGGLDIILDANGVSTLKQSYRHLAPMGKLVAYGFHSMLPKTGGRINWPKLIWNYLRTPRFSPFEMVSQNKNLICFNLSFLFGQKELLSRSMQQILTWFDQKKLRPPPVTTYSFEQVALAHKDLESGKTIGKLVLNVS